MRFDGTANGRRTFWMVLLGFLLLAGGALAVEAARDPARRPADRPPRFTVELRLDELGVTGFFTQVSGLGSESDIVEYRDGTDPNIVRKLPGRTKYDNVTLKRGMTSDISLWRWRQLVETGNIEDARTRATIVLLDRGTPVARFYLENAWPSKVSGPTLKSDGNDVAIEKLVIAHEGLTLE